jgi:phage protein D
MAEAAAPNVDIFLDGSDPDHEVPDGHIQSYTVHRDMFQADMAEILLFNQSDIYTPQKVGASIEIKVGGGSKPKISIYKGEIVGLEPTYKGGDKSRILIRGMNKFHRLIRTRKSVTFQDKTDEQILQQVVGDAGLSLEWKHEASIKYKHVYQHNQTDMEFLRTRAARMGCHVWCVDSTVYVKQPDLQSGPIAELNVDETSDTGALRSFSPRLNSSRVLNKVTVKGWCAETKELITGDASVQNSKLGSQTSVAGSGPLGNHESFMCDIPLADAAEAKALAKARLQEASLSYITGEAECQGSGVFELGKIVKITANAREKDDKFNGNYYVMGVTHRFNASKAKDGSAYITILRLARDAQSP